MGLSQDFGVPRDHQTNRKQSIMFLSADESLQFLTCKAAFMSKKTHPNLILHILLQTVGRLEDSSRPVELNSDMARHIESLTQTLAEPASYKA